MLKHLLLTACCFFIVLNTALAQNKLTYYFTKKGVKTDVPDSADYVRFVSDADSDTGFYNLKEYYRNGKPKLIGKTSTTDGSVMQGQCISFYANGKRQEMAFYKHGIIVGDTYHYYPNGKLYTIKTYRDGDEQIVACYDSTGKVLAANKTGYYIGFDADFKYIFEEGAITNGIKEGEWKGTLVFDTVKATYTETYKSGKFVIGHSVKNGQMYEYKQREVNPVYIGGEAALAKFILSHITYPSIDKKNNVYGKVYLQFVVERTGETTSFKVLRTPSESMGNEAIRVIKLTKWTPGLQYGLPVRVQYTIPINFEPRN